MNTIIQVNLFDRTSARTKASDMVHQSKCLPSLWDFSVKDTNLVPFYCFVKDYIGSSGGSSSTVAIDNKIEQAMDLVKSHLMFAVREEVDVLKERITELMDRISQLEHENGVLRANASPETLSMLSQSTHLNAQPQQQQQPNQPPSQSSQLSQSAAPPPPITVPPQQQQLPPHIQPALLNAQSQTMQIPSQQQLSA